MGGELGKTIRARRDPIGQMITDGMMLVGGEIALAKAATIGIGWISRSVMYTKSSLQMGRRMHALYKTHQPAKGLWKEYNKIKGIRPDFVDFNTKTIYELKPFNPKSIHRGYKQLERYKKAFEEKFGGEWKTVLDTY